MVDKTMRAAVFESEGVLRVKEIPVPKITKDDEMILKILTCSICGTDVHIMSVPPGYIAKPGTVLGHELVGEVVEVGRGIKSFQLGDRVVTNPNDYCGVCKYCLMNYPNQCENVVPMGIEADGGFAEYVKVSEKVAYHISKDVPIEEAAFAEPLACVVNGLNKLRVNPGESVAIIGAGPIGLLFVQLMKSCGAYPIIVSEPTELRRSYALRCGADYAVNPMERDLKDFVMEKTEIGMDHAIDVVGSQLKQALDLIRKGGKVLCFGVNTKATPTIIQTDVVFKEAQILGTWLANASFPRAVKILESRGLKLAPLITHRLPLERLSEGIELLRRGEGIEILIDP